MPADLPMVSDPLGINIEGYAGLVHCTRLFIQICFGMVKGGFGILNSTTVNISLLAVRCRSWDNPPNVDRNLPHVCVTR